MQTESSQMVLDERVETMPLVRKNIETTCGYCNEPLNKSTAYKSPGGYYYCNPKHFHAYTED